MDDLKSIAKAQEQEQERSVWGHKIIAVIGVGIVFYLAYCCVYQEFKILTFVNEWAYMILSMLNRVIMFLSELIRDLLQIWS